MRERHHTWNRARREEDEVAQPSIETPSGRDDKVGCIPLNNAYEMHLLLIVTPVA